MGILSKLFGSKNARTIKKLQPLIDQINGLGAEMEGKSDDELRGMTATFRERLDNGEPLDDLLPEAFAVVREASIRTVKMRHYDVQLVGGIVLHQGKIAEMRTGEGKTLVATLPAYLNALTGKGVHVVTVNDYLARRDAEWMGQIYKFLGLDVGVIVHGLSDYERQTSYNADITYGQNNEFGFDYLRDNMKTSPDRMVQRGLHYGIVDEVDSILIDEARTPLIISGAAEQSADLYTTVDRIVPRLKRDIDYTVDEKAHQTLLTDLGVERVQKLLDVDNLYDPSNIKLIHHVGQALRAHTLYKKDVNYLIEDGKIIIVDEHTGRKMPGRRWSDGLHQAIEAKEGVTIEEENQTLATVTFQNFFRMYEKLSGMTGTADTEAAEFHQIYKLDVVVIPTNKPIIRDDQPDLVYKNERGKFKAVIGDILDSHERGQPVLVGTVSVEKSEVLSKELSRHKVPYNVLNAKQHMREATVVAQAGRKGAITISTNMAGRGTDIVLGGNAEELAKADVDHEREAYWREKEAEKKAEKKKGKAKKGKGKSGNSAPNPDPAEADDPPDPDEPDWDARFEELFRRYDEQCKAEREEVLAAGGLRIVGTERHESRRIDNQLRGRAGRQGDPGSSRFYLSLEDDLMRIFMSERMGKLMERLGFEEEVPIESGMVTKSIEGAQKKVEGRNFDSRKNILEYDDVMDQQRKTIYTLRRQILTGLYKPMTGALTQDEKAKKEIEEEWKPPMESGPWTYEELREKIEPELTGLVDRLLERIAERDKLLEEAPPEAIESVDTRPAWRILRAEIWRTNGLFLADLQERMRLSSMDEVKTWIVDEVTKSLIQQRERLYDLCDAVVAGLVDTYCPRGAIDDWDLDGLSAALHDQFLVDADVGEHGGDQDTLAEYLWEQVEARIEEREEELGRPWLMYFIRHFYLEEIDQQWIDHLKMMDHLREGIYLRGYGQKDPKKEYKKEGFSLFESMMHRIQVNVAEKIFKVQIKREESEIPALEAKKRKTQERHDDASAAGTSAYGDAADGARQTRREKPKTVRREKPKIGRNDPCHCGSGKKYKKCHGRPGAEATG